MSNTCTCGCHLREWQCADGTAGYSSPGSHTLDILDFPAHALKLSDLIKEIFFINDMAKWFDDPFSG